MIDQKQQEEARARVEKLLSTLSYTATVTVETDSAENKEQENITINIEVDEPGYLIGRHGATLAALQHVIKLLLQDIFPEESSLNVDVNGYRQAHDERVRALAREAAAEALADNQTVTLRPMNGYERRLVHLELENNQQVKTESQGEGLNRQVIIIPVKE